MALFSQNMLELAVELAAHDPTYEDMVFKFVEHFYYIAAAMNRPGRDGMWDEEDGFYYDLLRLPDGSATRLKVRSMVGLLPLCATTVIEKWQRERVPRAMAAFRERLRRMPELVGDDAPDGPGAPRRGRARHAGAGQPGAAPPDPDEDARRGRVPGPLRHPRALQVPRATTRTSFHAGGQEYRVDYLPAESNTGMFGGNSNWRGPIWMPVNAHAHPGAAELLPVLRRQLQDRMPDRFGHA